MNSSKKKKSGGLDVNGSWKEENGMSHLNWWLSTSEMNLSPPSWIWVFILVIGYSGNQWVWVAVKLTSPSGFHSSVMSSLSSPKGCFGRWHSWNSVWRWTVLGFFFHSLAFDCIKQQVGYYFPDKGISLMPASLHWKCGVNHCIAREVHMVNSLMIWWYFIIFWPWPYSLQDLSSLTWDQTCAPCSGSPLCHNHWTAREFLKV